MGKSKIEWTQEQEEAVADTLMEMHTDEEVYVPNGTMGDIVTYNVCCRCQRESVWDKDSIRCFIREDANFTGDGDTDGLPVPKPGAIEAIVDALTDTSAAGPLLDGVRYQEAPR